MTKENKLDSVRKEIDRIDGEMSRLFSERMKAVAQIAEIKKESGQMITDKDREAEVKKRAAWLIDDEELKPLYYQFISDVIDISKKYQKTIIEDSKIKEYRNED